MPGCGTGFAGGKAELLKLLSLAACKARAAARHADCLPIRGPRFAISRTAARRLRESKLRAHFKIASYLKIAKFQ